MTGFRRLALAAALLAVALPAAAVTQADFPALKAGQWEMTTTSSAPGAKPRSSMICLDASTQKAMFDLSAGMQKDMCTKMDMRRDGAKFVTDAQCKLGNSVVTSHAVMTMTGDAAYRTESSATFDPPFNDLREARTVVEGKYLGACRDGMQPGDLVTGTGQKINLKDLPRRAPPAK